MKDQGLADGLMCERRSWPSTEQPEKRHRMKGKEPPLECRASRLVSPTKPTAKSAGGKILQDRKLADYETAG